MAVDLDQIARDTGVSRRTIYRVLNGGEQYQRPTFSRRAEHIRELAARQGYKPNAAARATASGRFDALAVLSRSNVSPTLHGNFLKGVYRALDERNLHLQIATVDPRDLDARRTAPRLIRELCVDGLLAHFGTELSGTAVRCLEGYGRPLIWVNTCRDQDDISCDFPEVTRRAVQALAALGHRRIAYVEPGHGKGQDFAPTPAFAGEQLAAGYASAMADAGLAVRCVRIGDMHARGVQRVTDVLALLRAPDRPTALVTASRHEAVVAGLAAQAAGLAVPADLSIVTLGDRKEIDIGILASCYQVPMRELGEQSVAMLMDKLEDATRVLEPRRIPFRPLFGRSHGPAS